VEKNFSTIDVRTANFLEKVSDPVTTVYVWCLSVMP